MNLTLTRREFRADGIFGVLTGAAGVVVAHTLEHAYPTPDGSWTPKLYAGTFTCQRGPHRLHGMTEDFITFEIMGVVDHEGILFHWGNFNRNSEGCVLLGEAEVDAGGQHMVTASRATFERFMALQVGCETFELTVIDTSNP